MKRPSSGCYKQRSYATGWIQSDTEVVLPRSLGVALNLAPFVKKDWRMHKSRETVFLL